MDPIKTPVSSAQGAEAARPAFDSDEAPQRRHDDSPADPLGRWPVDTSLLGPGGSGSDPWVAIVRTAIDAYARGLGPGRFPLWAHEATWRVGGNRSAVEYVGPRAIAAYHADLDKRSTGTYRQLIVALSASGGPIVEATVRTTAVRRHDRLDQPGLIVFEAGRGRIQRVTELPGDQAAWDAFWVG